MSKNELTKQIITLLAESGLSFDDKVKVIAEARDPMIRSLALAVLTPLTKR